MKKIKALVVLLMLALSANAQTIGDHLNDVMAELPGGEFETGANGNKTYTYQDDNFLKIYFLTDELYVRVIAIRPLNHDVRQSLYDAIVSKWTDVGDNSYRFLKDDGIYLQCNIRHVDNVGVVFWIKEAQ